MDMTIHNLSIELHNVCVHAWYRLTSMCKGRVYTNKTDKTLYTAALHKTVGPAYIHVSVRWAVVVAAAAG